MTTGDLQFKTVARLARAAFETGMKCGANYPGFEWPPDHVIEELFRAFWDEWHGIPQEKLPDLPLTHRGT